MKKHLEIWYELDKSPLTATEVLVCREFYGIAGIKDNVFCKVSFLQKRTGRSRDMIYRAIRGLKKKGWIRETKVKYQSVRAWKMVHYEFTKGQIDDVTNNQLIVNSDKLNSQHSFDEKSTLYIGSINESNESSVLKGKAVKKNLKESKRKETTGKNLYKNKSVDEIAKMQVEGVGIPTKITGTEICKLWDKYFCELYPDEIPPSMSDKNIAICNKIIKKIGKQDCKSVLVYVIKDWSYWVYEVSYKFGMKIPSIPILEFFLLYADHALKFWKDHQKMDIESSTIDKEYWDKKVPGLSGETSWKKEEPLEQPSEDDIDDLINKLKDKE